MKLDATLQPGQRITSCVWVCYLGEDLCAKCVLEMPHGSKVCASTLAYHRDRGYGGNSQSHASNFRDGARGCGSASSVNVTFLSIHDFQPRPLARPGQPQLADWSNTATAEPSLYC